jgi:hypothetical protein
MQAKITSDTTTTKIRPTDFLLPHGHFTELVRDQKAIIKAQQELKKLKPLI